jgi:hypothetical protein
MIERMAHHMPIQMAALAGVDLDRGGAGGADAVGVGAGLLVALDHATGNSAPIACSVAHSSVVLPDPGEDTRLSARMPCAVKRSRLAAA